VSSRVDDSVHVYPGCGLMTVESVRLNRYPRTERGVHRAKRIIQRWCDRQNTKLDKGAALLSRHGGPG
jgi:hypothetical protein